jgi:predicted aspartyl protease
MGMFQVRVRVANPSEPDRSFEELFWVDTGALYSFVPGQRLEEIGLVPIRSRDLVLADGRRDTRPLGEARFTIEGIGEALTCPVIFGPEDSLYSLGATALEIFGVDADPATKTLKPILSVIGGLLASRAAP